MTTKLPHLPVFRPESAMHVFLLPPPPLSPTTLLPRPPPPSLPRGPCVSCDTAASGPPSQLARILAARFSLINTGAVDTMARWAAAIRTYVLHAIMTSVRFPCQGGIGGRRRTATDRRRCRRRSSSVPRLRPRLTGRRSGIPGRGAQQPLLPITQNSGGWLIEGTSKQVLDDEELHTTGGSTGLRKRTRRHSDKKAPRR